ncbi:hypothetical protein BASA81_000099 [Batrachochytrium salamandrivorans]|nr:hypothetical protein BASA81_000099 [Batrachochytrium salamandrivorans]
MTLPLLVLLLAVLAGFVLVESKTVSGTFQLTAGDFTSGPEYEISKFSFVVGKGQIRGEFKYQDPQTWMTSPALYLFRDESWSDYHKALTCEDKATFAFKAILIGKPTQSHMKLLKRQLDAPALASLEQDTDGLMKWKFSWEFDTEERTTGWFLIAADCALEQFNAEVPKMHYEIELLNPDNTHLPADEFGLPKLYLVTFVFLILYSVKLVLFDMQSKRPDGDREKIQLVVYLLFFSYFALTASLGSELAHLFVYKQNGRGVYLFDLMSDVFDGICQLTVAFVLICLASGWTLVEMEDDSVKKNSLGSLLRHPQNLVKGGNVVGFAVAFVVLVSFVLQFLNKQLDEDFTKFHDYDSYTTTDIVW